jgi:MFS family permease
MNTSSSAVTPGERRWKMMARGRLLARVMIFATAIGNLLGVIAGLIVFGYYPSAAIITVLLLIIIVYIPVAVKKWLVVMEKNETAHRQLAKQLLDGGGEEVETEIHVHTERMLIRAKTPVTRFMIVWPMLSVVFPLAVAAAAIESHMYVLSGVDSSLNKLLLILMASSIRSIFQTVAVFEALANLAARAVRRDAMDVDEDV